MKSGNWAVSGESREYAVSPESGLCIVIAAEELGLFAEMMPVGLSILAVEEVEKARLLLIDSSGQRYVLAAAPMLCLGLITSDQAYVGRLEQTRHLISSWADIDIPATVVAAIGNLPAELSRVLISNVVERMQAYGAQVARLSRELFRIRVDHENTLNAFASLEGFVAQANLQPCNLTFDNLPQGSEVVLAVEVAAIGQILPVSTFGLSVIQLHLTDWSLSDLPVGGLNIELRSVEDREILGVWDVPLEELTPGWLALSLDAGISGLQRTPKIVLRPLGGFGILPPLSFGELQPLRRFRVYQIDAGGANVEFSERSLALRTWSGLPGVRPPGAQRDFHIRQEARHSEIRDIVVPFTLLRGIEETLSAWSPEFLAVEYLPELRGFLCHPPPIGMTWAVLSSFPTAGQPFRLSARAEIRSEQSLPVDFGIVLSSFEAERIQAEINMNPEARNQDGLVFSGWRSAAHGEIVRPSMLVASELGMTANLYFVTRMTDAKSNAYAWACFYDIRKTLLGGATKYSAINSVTESSSDGTLLSIASLKAVENAMGEAVAGVPTVLYDDDRRGIFCHPPANGIALGKLRQIGEGNPFRFSATARIVSEQSQSVDFSISISSLNSQEVLESLELIGVIRSDDCFVSTGWHTISYGNDKLLEIDSLRLLSNNVDVYIATRMSTNSTTNDFAWAYYFDARLLSLSQSAAVDHSA